MPDINCGILGSGNTDAWIVAFDLTTGITNTVNDNLDFLIYPNPTKNEIIIQNNNSEISYSISIFDVFGNKVFTEWNVTSASHKISATDFISGIYFISIEPFDGIYFNSKIIVQN